MTLTIEIDSSVPMKWFKTKETNSAEAADLGSRLMRGELPACANEILSLEVVRGLRRTQVLEPHLGVTVASMDDAFQRIEHLFEIGYLKKCGVSGVKTL